MSTPPPDLTYNELIAIDACINARRWFWAICNQGDPSSRIPITKALAACKMDSWVVLLASYRFPQLAYTWAGHACATLGRGTKMEDYANAINHANMEDAYDRAYLLWEELPTDETYRLQSSLEHAVLPETGFRAYRAAAYAVGPGPDVDDDMPMPALRAIAAAWLLANGPPPEGGAL